MAEYVGLTNPIEMEAGQANQPYRVCDCFGDLQGKELAKYCVVAPDGKVTIAWDKAILAYPEKADRIKAIRNSENKDIIHNFFTRL